MAEEKVEVEETAAETAAPAASAEQPAESAPAAKEKKTEAASEAPAEDNKPKLATAAELLADAVVEPIKRRKGSKNVPFGIAFVKTTFNNTIVSITDSR